MPVDVWSGHVVSILSSSWAAYLTANPPPTLLASLSRIPPNKKTYQMDPANYREAIREAKADEAEGADIMMVKVRAGPVRWPGEQPLFWAYLTAHTARSAHRRATTVLPGLPSRVCPALPIVAHFLHLSSLFLSPSCPHTARHAVPGRGTPAA